ncbi:hypothetical protein ScPMuIL_004111 [Solemya velum]
MRLYVASRITRKIVIEKYLQTFKAEIVWQDNLTLDEGTIQDLQWWEKALLSWNGTKVVHQAIDLQLITDASSTGWGAVLEQKEARGLWNQEMSLEHSNVRKMMAVLLALKSFRSQVHNKVVQLLSDNISTVAYIHYQGGSSVRLTQLATAIWAELIDNKVSLVAKHIAGSQNVHSDFLSRLESHSDWKMNTGLFQYLDRVWGPHTIDRCASFLTKQIPCYNSLFYDPFTSGIDCLGQRDWWQHNNFVNPPFKIIPHVLRVIIDQSAEATVIAPWWPGKPWLQTSHAKSNDRTAYRGLSTDCWVGGSDKDEEGTFVWSHSAQKFAYINWSNNQPDDYRMNEECVCLLLHSQTTTKWNDEYCGFKLNYICEGRRT